MEIHAPDKPIHNIRDVLIHLGIVTIGILIALGLETLVEWRHHAKLAEEARTNILNEIRDNRNDLDFYLKALPSSEQQISRAMAALETIRKNRHAGGSISVNLHGSDLNDASWVTSQSVGAFAYMDYKDLKTYDQVYNLQQTVKDSQRDAMRSLAVALAFDDPAIASDLDLKTDEQRFREVGAKLMIAGEYAEQLRSRYDSVLSSKH